MGEFVGVNFEEISRLDPSSALNISIQCSASAASARTGRLLKRGTACGEHARTNRLINAVYWEQVNPIRGFDGLLRSLSKSDEGRWPHMLPSGCSQRIAER